MSVARDFHGIYFHAMEVKGYWQLCNIDTVIELNWNNVENEMNTLLKKPAYAG